MRAITLSTIIRACTISFLFFFLQKYKIRLKANSIISLFHFLVPLQLII